MIEESGPQFMADLLSVLQQLREELDGLVEVVEEHDNRVQGQLRDLDARLSAVENNTPEPPPDPEPEPHRYMWLSPNDIYSLSDGTEAWRRLRTWAERTTSPILCDQDNQGETIAVAAAVMAVRYGDQVMRGKA